MKNVLSNTVEKLILQKKTALVENTEFYDQNAYDEFISKAFNDYSGDIVYEISDIFFASYVIIDENSANWVWNNSFMTADMSKISRSVRHRHNYIEMTYVLEGSLQQVIGDKVLHLKSGDLSVVDSNTYHYEKNWEKDTMILWLCFKKEIFDYQLKFGENKSVLNKFICTALKEQRRTSEYIIFRPFGSTQNVDDLILNILVESKNKKPGYQDMMKIFTMRLVQTIYSEYNFIVTEEESPSTDESFFRILDRYIRDNLESVSIAELEERFHFSRNYYNQVIRKQTGMTYTQYLQKLRMEKSANLLKNTNLPVGAVMNSIGLSGRQYFYTLFEQEYNMTPKEYREINKAV